MIVNHFHEVTSDSKEHKILWAISSINSFIISGDWYLLPFIQTCLSSTSLSKTERLDPPAWSFLMENPWRSRCQSATNCLIKICLRCDWSFSKVVSISLLTDVPLEAWKTVNASLWAALASRSLNFTTAFFQFEKTILEKAGSGLVLTLTCKLLATY